MIFQEKKHKRDTGLLRSSLKISTVEGSWWGIMHGTVESYFSAFYEYLRYSSYEISILATFPVFFGSVIQKLSKKAFSLIQSRRLLIVILKWIQTVTIPIIFYIGFISGHYVLMLLFVCLFYTCSLSIAAPFMSWMGYLVPGKIRGKYFGLRTQYIKLFMLISSLIAGSILHSFTASPLIGFGIIFFLGMTANVLSTLMISKKYEPPYNVIDEDSQKVDIRKSNFSNLKNYIRYDCLSELSFSISAPLIMVYWLRNLNFNYIELAILINVGHLFSLVSLKYFGQKIDVLGTYFAIKWTSILVSLLPVLWILVFYMPNHLKLIVSMVIFSIGSILFNTRVLAMDNKLFEHMDGKNMINITSKRVFYRGIFIFIGGIIGGSLTKLDSQNYFISLSCLDTPIHLVFIVSTLFRLIVWRIYLYGKLDSI